MRSRTSLALAGALLVTLVPGAALATPEAPSGGPIAVATMDAPVTAGGGELADDEMVTVDGSWFAPPDPDPAVTDEPPGPDDVNLLIPQVGVVLEFADDADQLR